MVDCNNSETCLHGFSTIDNISPPTWDVLLCKQWPPAICYNKLLLIHHFSSPDLAFSPTQHRHPNKKHGVLVLTVSNRNEATVCLRLYTITTGWLTACEWIMSVKKRNKKGQVWNSEHDATEIVYSCSWDNLVISHFTLRHLLGSSILSKANNTEVQTCHIKRQTSTAF